MTKSIQWDSLLFNHSVFLTKNNEKAVFCLGVLEILIIVSRFFKKLKIETFLGRSSRSPDLDLVPSFSKNN